MDSGHKPPKSVSAAARRGLEMYANGEAGDGLESATVARARKIAAGDALTDDHVKRMHSFFERHDKTRPADGGKGKSPWRTAWMLWGGNAGRSWAASVANSLEGKSFSWDFAVEGKAVEGADGDIYIEGYASDFDIDRDGEYIVPGALQKALDSYMQNPVLCYHHKMSEAMGQVVEAKVDGKGLWIKARVDQPEPGTEAANRFRQVAKGTLRGFSIGGFFKKAVERGRTMIREIDLVEISLTPTPVNPRTLGTVVGKALMDDDAAEGENESNLIECLETALSSAVVLYFLAHGSHWNVKGPAFGAYHELFSEIYEDILESLDPMAEQMLKQGVDAPFTLAEFMEESVISVSSPSDDSPEALVTMLLSANAQMLTALNSLFAEATTANAQGLANFAADRIDAHMKWAWQLRRSIQNPNSPVLNTTSLDMMEEALRRMS